MAGWEMDHLSVIFLLKPPFMRIFQHAMFDDQRVFPSPHGDFGGQRRYQENTMGIPWEMVGRSGSDIIPCRSENSRFQWPYMAIFNGKLLVITRGYPVEIVVELLFSPWPP